MSKVLEAQKIEVIPIQPGHTSDKDQILSEFVGIDFTQDEIKSLALGDLKLKISADGSAEKITVKDPDLGQNMRHRIVAYLLARGYDKKEMQAFTGYSRAGLNQVLRMPWVREAALKFQDKIIEHIENDKKLAMARMGQLSIDAVETLEQGLYSDDESIQHKSAIKILEGIGVYNQRADNISKIEIGVQIGALIKEGSRP